MDHRYLKQQLIKHYCAIRNKTEWLCQPLATEDYVVQSIEDVSPPKWHLAHTTWFFETFILLPKVKDYQVFNPLFHYLFNSYYQKLGLPFPRMQRGILSRPTVENIYLYRNFVNQHLTHYLENLSDEDFAQIQPLIVLGLHHEEQHQELLLMDIKHNFSYDPTFPVYHPNQKNFASKESNKLDFIELKGGVIDIGYDGQAFCFDNELPRHQTIIKPYQLANRLVTNGEFYEFIDADGYKTPDHWLADGWDAVQREKWMAPLYWHHIDNEWYVYTLSGLKNLNPNEPVVHLSYYEADAYARWKKMRLPSEVEWEYAARQQNEKIIPGNFLESQHFHPLSFKQDLTGLQQLFGDVWEWTMSPYTPYPGFSSRNDALGEYNGKFMSNQMVLRGGSCVTPKDHIRSSYRNFFQPEKRWQFGGIRLANYLKEKS